MIVKELNWNFICSFKSNRKVSVTKSIRIFASDLPLADKQARKVMLKGYGYVMIRKLVAKNGDIAYLGINDLALTDYHSYKSRFDCRLDD